MTHNCKDMLKKAADELFALSLILALLERREQQDPSLPAKGLATVGKCQKLLRLALGQSDEPTQH